MEDANALRERIKNLMVENLMLQIGPAEIGDELPLFGPGSLGLDAGQYSLPGLPRFKN